MISEIDFYPFRLKKEDIPEKFKQVQIIHSNFILLDYCLPVSAIVDNCTTLYEIISESIDCYLYYENQMFNHELEDLVIEQITIGKYSKKYKGAEIEIFIGS